MTEEAALWAASSILQPRCYSALLLVAMGALLLFLSAQFFLVHIGLTVVALS